MNTYLIQSITKMIPNGNRLELPKNDHFANYAQVKKTLLTAELWRLRNDSTYIFHFAVHS